MTKEQLKQEAEEWVKKEYPTLEINAVAERYCKAYLAGAEPREKKIRALGEHCLQLQKDKGNLTDRVRELEQQIKKMQEKLKADLIARLEEQMQYSTSLSCTKGMELFIKSIEKWEIKEK